MVATLGKDYSNWDKGIARNLVGIAPPRDCSRKLRSKTPARIIPIAVSSLILCQGAKLTLFWTGLQPQNGRRCRLRADHRRALHNIAPFVFDPRERRGNARWLGIFQLLLADDLIALEDVARGDFTLILLVFELLHLLTVAEIYPDIDLVIAVRVDFLGDVLAIFLYRSEKKKTYALV